MIVCDVCGGNENQRRLCGAPRVFVPPVEFEATYDAKASESSLAKVTS